MSIFKSLFRKKNKKKASEVNFDDITNKLLVTNSKLAEQLRVSK